MKNLKNIKLINKIALLIDFLVILTYLVFFIIFYSKLVIPNDISKFENPERYTQTTYELFGRIFSNKDLNVLISYLVVFLVIGIPLLVLNLKHNKKMYDIDYTEFEGINLIIRGLLSILTLNFISLILRIYNGHLLMKYNNYNGYIDYFKIKIKDKKEKKNNQKEIKDLTEQEIQLKHKIKKQSILKFTRYFFTYLFLILFAVFVLIPFYWMILTSLKVFNDSNSTNPSLWVPFKDLQWINIKFVIKELNFGLYIKNTLIVALFSTLGTTIIVILSAYAFSKMEFKGRDVIFSILLMTMMVPGEIFMLTNFLTVSKSGFGWIGGEKSTSLGYFATMILPNMVSVFYIFFLRQTFKQVPDSLYKAAKVDGCSDFKFLRRVMVPIASPTIITIIILNVLGSWSAFIWPRLITSIDPINGENYWLISVALRDKSFVLDKGAVSETMFNLQIAAAAIVTIPLLIVFFVLKKYIMNGVGRSGTKG